MNRAWKQYQQTQVDILRNQLEQCLSIDYDGSVDEIAQQIVDQVTKEREDARQKYDALERTNNDLRSEDNIESIRESYMNTVNELNQELLAMKEAYDQLDNEKQFLVSELEKRSIEADRNELKPTTGMLCFSYIPLNCIVFYVLEKISSNIWRQPFDEVIFVFYCLFLNYMLPLSSRFLFIPVVLILNKMQKNSDNFEKIWQLLLLNVHILMKPIEHGNSITIRN
jgi:hypothetical protein